MMTSSKRILFISNFYPPASRGGFEEWCREVLEALRERGHEVQVLTSNYAVHALSETNATWVHRDLLLEMEFGVLQNAWRFFTVRAQREAANLARVRELIAQFRPEAVMLWGMWNLHRSIPALVEELMPGRVVYYMGDFWPTLPGQFKNYWEAPARGRAARLVKRLLRPLALRMLSHEKQPTLLLEHVIFPSLFMKGEFERRGIRPECTEVIYGSVDTSPYLEQNRSDHAGKGVSLLYVGRLTPEKGVHTTIEALGHLVLRLGVRKTKLTIIGEGIPEYLRLLRDLAREKGIESLVTFLPMQPKEALPELYQQAGVFLFPSIWDEPFGRVIVEAMASGLAVVGTRVGGAAELLLEEETALVFPPEDALGLALQVKRLIDSPELRARLSRRGREFAVSRFDIRRMAGEIEASLMRVASG